MWRPRPTRCGRFSVLDLASLSSFTAVTDTPFRSSSRPSSPAPTARAVTTTVRATSTGVSTGAAFDFACSVTNAPQSSRVTSRVPCTSTTSTARRVPRGVSVSSDRSSSRSLPRTALSATPPALAVPPRAGSSRSTSSASSLARTPVTPTRCGT